MAAGAVKDLMQRKLDTDPDLSEYDLEVIDVSLVNKAGNEHKGIATVRMSDGVDHDVPVEVTASQREMSSRDSFCSAMAPSAGVMSFA